MRGTPYIYIYISFLFCCNLLYVQSIVYLSRLDDMDCDMRPFSATCTELSHSHDLESFGTCFPRGFSLNAWFHKPYSCSNALVFSEGISSNAWFYKPFDHFSTPWHPARLAAAERESYQANDFETLQSVVQLDYPLARPQPSGRATRP